LGFDISDFGKNSFQINGVPSNLESSNATTIIEGMIDTEKNKAMDGKSDIHEMIALSLAKSMAIKSGQILGKEELIHLFNQLFATSNPNYSPEGKPIISILSNEELEKRFK
jgi:DNA mismatch repair protein MutL